MQLLALVGNRDLHRKGMRYVPSHSNLGIFDTSKYDEFHEPAEICANCSCVSTACFICATYNMAGGAAMGAAQFASSECTFSLQHTDWRYR